MGACKTWDLALTYNRKPSRQALGPRDFLAMAHGRGVGVGLSSQKCCKMMPILRFPLDWPRKVPKMSL